MECWDRRIHRWDIKRDCGGFIHLDRPVDPGNVL